MDKKDFFRADGFFVQSDKYILKALSADEKDMYLKLYRENSIVATASSKMSDIDFDEFTEFVWEKIPEEDSLYVSVYLKSGYTYVGNIVMQNLSSHTPEIGIDVIKQYHRQRIAYETIQLFTRKIQELISVDYFLVRIYSDNEPSQKLFAKLGAELLGKEPSEFAVVLSKLKENFREEYSEFLLQNPDVDRQANERCILQFKYLPDGFNS